MNIYVGNLPYTAADDDLRKLFEEYGAVDSARVIVDRATNQSKGFGFVEMGDDGEANGAISALDGNEFMGRRLRANEARPRERREGPSY
jgi:cold-inducible RNA-binding protein